MLRLSGTFDARSAHALRAALNELADRPVTLDFSRVPQFHDLAVAILASAAGFPGLAVRGLGRHHERLFRYFGAGSAAAAPDRDGEGPPASAPCRGAASSG